MAVTGSGTHSNTVCVDGVLKLSGMGLFDAIPDLDAVDSLDSYGGINIAGTYTFANADDRGSVTRLRATSNVEALIVNVNDQFDSRTGNIDDWADFDATEGAEADAWVEMRETDDDPAGAPAWSDWKRLDSSEHECRAMQFRAQLETEDPAYNIHITSLSVTVETRV